MVIHQSPGLSYVKTSTLVACMRQVPGPNTEVETVYIVLLTRTYQINNSNINSITNSIQWSNTR